MSNQQEPEQFRKLFIGGLSYETTEDSLKSYFGKWGDICDCVVMRDPNTKRSRGFGFITYERADSLDEAQANRPHTLDKKEVETKRATPREESGKPEAHMTIKKVFVGGVKDDTEDEHLRDYFSKYGNVLKVDIITDKETKKKRGFAFVEFDDYDPVDKVVLEKNHYIAGKRCDVKKAVDKKDLANMPQRGGMNGGRGGGRGGRGGGGGSSSSSGWMGNDRNSNFGGGNQSYGNNSGNYGGGNYGGGTSSTSSASANTTSGNYGGGNFNGGGDNWNNNQGGGNGWNNQGGGNGWNNQGGGNWGNNQGGGSYNDGGGNQWGNNSGGNYGSGPNNQQQSYGGGYNNQGGGGGGGGSGGPMKGGNYTNRGSGPYGGGYGNQGGGGYGGGGNQQSSGGGGGGGGNYGGGYNRR